MEKTSQTIDDVQGKLEAAADGDILFESGLYYQDERPDDCMLEEMTFNSVMQSMEALYAPSVFVGTVGVWSGRFTGYRYCCDFKDFMGVIGNYDDITIRQVGTQLHFTLRHHDGRHEMELRRLTDYGCNHLSSVDLEHFSEETVQFIKRHTRNFGKIPAVVR